MSLFSRLHEPVGGVFSVVLDAFPLQAELAQQILRVGHLRFRSLHEIVQSERNVFLYDSPFQTLLAQTVGGIGVAVVSGLGQPVDALYRIAHLDIFREV